MEHKNSNYILKDFFKTECVQTAGFSYTAMPVIALQIFAIFDVSPGSDADASQHVRNAVLVPQEGLSLTDGLSNGLHHSYIKACCHQPCICRLCCLWNKDILHVINHTSHTHAVSNMSTTAMQNNGEITHQV